MLQSGNKKKQPAVEKGFPLNKVYFPMRMNIFKAMKMDQLVKMAFESLEAARDIQSAQIRPKVMSITFGEYSTRRVRFDLDGYSVTAGIKRLFRGEYINKNLISTKTFSGEVLDECVSNKTSVYVFAQGEANFTDVVKNVYQFLCDLFCEPTTTNVDVNRELSYLFPVFNSIRKITSLNRLDLCGYWGSREDQKEMFEEILKSTKFNHLAIQDFPPVGTKPVKITTDKVVFVLHSSSWLSEPRLQEVDAKKIILHSSHSINLLAERFNFVLKSWHKGTRFQRLESITFDGFESAHIAIAKGRLPTKPWNKYRRPGYYCDYETGKDGEKKSSNFYDIRTAEDLTNQKGELGTIIAKDLGLIFVVWTQKELENVRGAYAHIEKACQKQYEKKIELERKMVELKSVKWNCYHEVISARKELDDTITAIQRCESRMKTIEECA